MEEILCIVTIVDVNWGRIVENVQYVEKSFL